MTAGLDRLALAAELAALAERFETEAGQWREDHAARECIRAAGQLRTLVDTLDDRQLDPDLDVARGFVLAADLLLSQLEGTRRFFRSIASRPRGGRV